MGGAPRVELIWEWASQVASASELTIFLHGIPEEATKDHVMRWIDQGGLGAAYDFLYLPRCPATGMGKGHAFINFVDEEAAETLRRLVSLPDAGPWASVVATSSLVQGLADNLVLLACSQEVYLRDPENFPYVPLLETGAFHPVAALMTEFGSPEEVVEADHDQDAEQHIYNMDGERQQQWRSQRGALQNEDGDQLGQERAMGNGEPTPTGASNSLGMPAGGRSAITLVLRNLPARCSLEETLEMIRGTGFMGSFEFLYIPMQPSGRKNKGYAFVGFSDVRHAEGFSLWVDGAMYSGRTSIKAVSVELANRTFSMSSDQMAAMTCTTTQWGPVFEDLLRSPPAGSVQAAMPSTAHGRQPFSGCWEHYAHGGMPDASVRGRGQPGSSGDGCASQQHVDWVEWRQDSSMADPPTLLQGGDWASRQLYL